MAYPIDKKFVVAVASSALFDLSESDSVYRHQGVEKYRRDQREKETVTLKPGVAFPLVRRLRLNEGMSEMDAPVEVVLLSRNDPDTGLRVLNSIESHTLPMSRAVFVAGGGTSRCYATPGDTLLFERYRSPTKHIHGRARATIFVWDQPT